MRKLDLELVLWGCLIRRDNLVRQKGELSLKEKEKLEVSLMVRWLVLTLFGLGMLLLLSSCWGFLCTSFFSRGDR